MSTQQQSPRSSSQETQQGSAAFSQKGPRVNRAITALTVRVIASDDEVVGVMAFSDALALAQEEGLDLVEVAPKAAPPVCKIMDAGKYRYETQRKMREARKKQKVAEMKEVKFRPTIGQHDYEIKCRSIIKFLEDGHRVRVTLRFRGREITHQEVGVHVFEKLANDLKEYSKLEVQLKLDGKQLLMVFAPKA